MNSCIRMKIEAETELMKIEPVTYAEIDLQALAGNYRRLKALMAPTVRMAAVIKADAYGHGAAETARTALNEGASFLVVARPEEAFELRAAGIAAPVLLLGALPPENAREAAAAGITLSVNGFDDARELSGRLGGASVKVHLKVDTGMGRLGFSFNEFSADISDALRTVRSVASLPGVELEGLYTHFASADAAEEETAFCLTQFDSFSRLIRILEKENLRPPICHCANSAATLRFPQMHLDMCRVGIVQYGLRPSEFVDVAALGFRPVMTLRSRIIYLKEVPAGFPISYGSIWKSHHPSRIATVAVGYGDGYHRCLSNRGEMLLRGKRVPVVGRVCMDLTMIDVSAVPEASVGDEVTVWGTEGNKTLSADEVAAAAGTIGYEMTTGLNVRVPRIFKE